MRGLRHKSDLRLDALHATLSNITKVIMMGWRAWEEHTVPSGGDDLTPVARGEGRAMTLEQAIEYALVPETG
jgi:hypothetical protein